MTTLESVAHLSDSQLLAAVKAAAQDERHATARIVTLLAHVDQRRLYPR
jgi:hypothetical protein